MTPAESAGLFNSFLSLSATKFKTVAKTVNLHLIKHSKTNLQSFQEQLSQRLYYNSVMVTLAQ